MTWNTQNIFVARLPWAAFWIGLSAQVAGAGLSSPGGLRAEPVRKNCGPSAWDSRSKRQGSPETKFFDNYGNQWTFLMNNKREVTPVILHGANFPDWQGRQTSDPTP
jgi:hypothetical protein